MALALFALSTRQFPGLARVAVWTAGATALVGAIASSAIDRDNHGLLTALVEATGHLGKLGDSVLGQALARNYGAFGHFLRPALDFALLVACFLALVCLLALTPGERTEKAVRPFLAGLVGLVIGAALTVAVVAIGFGGEAHRPTLVAQLQEKDVTDGDTIWMGSTSVRIWGLDAPELKQTCRAGRPCGEDAREALVHLVDGELVTCDAKPSKSGRRMESFGRPLMTCRVGGVDLALSMIASGWAAVYRDENWQPVGDANYAAAEELAKAKRLALWSDCTLMPREWRNDAAARTVFQKTNAPPARAIGWRLSGIPCKGRMIKRA